MCISGSTCRCADDGVRQWTSDTRTSGRGRPAQPERHGQYRSIGAGRERSTAGRRTGRATREWLEKARFDGLAHNLMVCQNLFLA